MKIEITRVESAFDGVSFGSVGPYEKVVGRAFGEVDPFHHLNTGIVNIGNAPRNSAGHVEYWVDFFLLKPVDIRKSNRRILYDVLNRGTKLALTNFNDAPRLNYPVTSADAGNGFLMRQGYAILWSAWQGDIGEGDDRMLAGFPVATNNGAPMVAINRDEFIFENTTSPATAVLSYPANTLDQRQAALTVRACEKDPRVAILAENWRYLSATQIEISRPPGFDAGAIYEFIYQARNPIVMGLGFAAMRDLVAFIRHESADAGARLNPLDLGAAGPAVDHVLAFGSSQSGRFLRDFLWQGFNQDLNGRRVFDGVISSVAGSRKTFTNFAFAQPGRFSRQHEDHLFPGDQFPFSYATRFDPVSGKTDGILARCKASNTCPKIMQTEASSDFWQGRSSLIVSDATGDITLPDEVRVYLFSSIQHGGPLATASFPFTKYPANPLDYSGSHRALLVALDEWVSRGVLPPPSRFPRSGDGTLAAPLPQSLQGFPIIPGVTYKGRVNELSEMDYSLQPSKPIPGHNYIVLVPKVDTDGNDIAGIRLPEIAVPLGTHTGWNLRCTGFAEGEVTLVGAYFPFAATAKQRVAAGDPRPSLEERYPSHDHYVNAVARAAAELQKDRLLLAEDVQRYIAAAAIAPVGK
jgi:hypothetical protein